MSLVFSAKSVLQNLADAESLVALRLGKIGKFEKMAKAYMFVGEIKVSLKMSSG